jgi:predicted secreted protein
MIKVGFAAATLVMIGCHGCTSGNAPPAQPPAPRGADPVAAGELVLHAEDDGKAFDVVRGSSVTVRLANNAGTGYIWTLTPVDATVLAARGDRTTEIASDIAGGPTADVYRFVAVGPGTGSVELALKRPFGSAPPGRVVHFTVRVH